MIIIMKDVVDNICKAFPHRLITKQVAVIIMPSFICYSVIQYSAINCNYIGPILAINNDLILLSPKYKYQYYIAIEQYVEQLWIFLMMMMMLLII
jgi:hypothetical protein